MLFREKREKDSAVEEVMAKAAAVDEEIKRFQALRVTPSLIPPRNALTY